MSEFSSQSKIENQEILEIKERLQNLEEQLKKEKQFENKEKLIKQEIKSYIQEFQKSPSFISPVQTRDEADEIKKMEPDQQVGALISLVFEKGLPQAIAIIRSLDNPAILDEFHDTLVDHYFELMVQKGIITF